MSLDDVKTVKNTFGCTVNDVVLAICAAGLRSWLDERGELPAEPLLGFIPVSVRTPEQMGTFGNRVSVMIAELPTETADPVQRLRRINETMKSAKERHKALPASLMQDANHFIPPALLAQAGRATSRFGIRGYRSAGQRRDLERSGFPDAVVPRRCTPACAVPDLRGARRDRPEHHRVQLPGLPGVRDRRRSRTAR